MKNGLRGMRDNRSVFEYMAGIIALTAEAHDDVSQPDSKVKQTWPN
jgi:hypothetical protein